MQQECPPTLADEIHAIDGYTYKLFVEAVADGFQAQLVWISAPSERGLPPIETLTTPTFHDARGAIIEARSLALEYVLAWRTQ
ncbi:MULTISPECIES: hypothetical protein [unclassified Duganella]|uniref:hypothetical protein n=1 Tax=unclassified Duganella TaxID=2636909 RepID=UPI00070C2D1D|nr:MULTISPECIES: hypothetical protein [unclassified Duganella]KRC01404.1 hypothetical protein ASE26_20460 [Duganella sp. Root198D2]